LIASISKQNIFYVIFCAIHRAFLVAPMVGAFFINIVNALVIKRYLPLPVFG
jgi:sodium--glutamate symport carrier gltS